MTPTTFDPMGSEELSVFKHTIAKIMQDETRVNLQMGLADVELIMSILLEYYPKPDIPDEAAEKLMEMCRQLSNIVEYYHPDSEPYLAFIFGLAMMQRADWHW